MTPEKVRELAQYIFFDFMRAVPYEKYFATNKPYEDHESLNDAAISVIIGQIEGDLSVQNHIAASRAILGIVGSRSVNDVAESLRRLAIHEATRSVPKDLSDFKSELSKDDVATAIGIWDKIW